jgi:hypothetical protein
MLLPGTGIMPAPGLGIMPPPAAFCGTKPPAALPGICTGMLLPKPPAVKAYNQTDTRAHSMHVIKPPLAGSLSTAPLVHQDELALAGVCLLPLMQAKRVLLAST